MDPKEETIRLLYDARARRDWDGVRDLLAEEVGWHEPGEEDHSGNFRGREEVVALLQKLVEITDGTFQLEPDDFVNLEAHSVARIRWWAERAGRRSEGEEIAVFRFQEGKIVQVWFYNEPSDSDAFSAVFAFN